MSRRDDTVKRRNRPRSSIQSNKKKIINTRKAIQSHLSSIIKVQMRTYFAVSAAIAFGARASVVV